MEETAAWTRAVVSPEVSGIVPTKQPTQTGENAGQNQRVRNESKGPIEESAQQFQKVDREEISINDVLASKAKIQSRLSAIDEKINKLSTSFFSFLHKGSIQRLKEERNALKQEYTETLVLQQKAYNRAAISPALEEVKEAIDKFEKGEIKEEDLKGALGKYIKNLEPSASIKPFLHLLPQLSEEGKEAFYNVLQELDVHQMDKMADRIVKEGGAQTPEIIKGVMHVEIDKSEDKGSLLRANSMAMKLLSGYQKQEAKTFIRENLGGFIKGLQSQKREHEVDPSKLKAGQDIEQNQKYILDQAASIITGVAKWLNSNNRLPAELEGIYQEMYSAIEDKFNDENVAKKQVVANLFLRLVCPAIVSPEGEGFGIEHAKYTPSQQRDATLITKVMQNWANEVVPQKEPFMEFSREFASKQYEGERFNIYVRLAMQNAT